MTASTYQDSILNHVASISGVVIAVVIILTQIAWLVN